MTRYIWKGDGFYDREGQRMAVPAGPICAPNVMSDIPEYASPIDGRMITSRSYRRDDLARNNCVEYEPSMSPTKGKFKNPEFCRKRGLQVSEEFR